MVLKSPQPHRSATPHAASISTAFTVRHRGPAWRQSDLPALIDPVGLLQGPQTRLIKRGLAGRTVALVRCGDRDLVVKLFDESILRRRLVRLFTGSAAARARAGAAKMQAAGLTVPALVAVLATSDFAIRPASCVVTEFLAGERANELWRRMSGRPRRRFVAALASRLRAIHLAGLYPQDVGMVNWIAEPTAGGLGWDLVLVDLDRVRRYSRLSWQRRIKNLVQLEMSFGDTASDREKMLFLRSYLGEAGRDAGRIEEARIAGEIAAGAAAKRRRDAARRARQSDDRSGDLL